VSAVVAGLALACGLVACGSDDEGPDGGPAAAASGGNAAAEAAIEPYVGQPSAFPVSEPLRETPKGATVAFMDCGTPVCALFWQLLEPAAKTMGVRLTRYEAGSAADTVAAAWDSVVAARPDAVIAAAIDIELWNNQLERLQEADIPVVTTGVLGTAEYGIEAAQISETWSELAGRLMANYVAARFGPDSEVTVYDVPELTFTQLVSEAFQAELPKACSSCSVRVAHIPVATTGNTAPNRIVSDLQAHPETTVIVFASDETQSGLPAALQTAGIEVQTLGLSPSPTNLQYVKEGKEDAVLAVDLPVLAWTLLDQAARRLAGQELKGDEAEGITDMQFLTQGDITFDPSKGWTGYPDFAQRFAKLWGVGG
jgi:ribose transport system substrate-binding protein